MVFSSLVFLCLFLPAFLIVYTVLPRLRVVALVVFSLAFYAYGEPVWVLALLLSGIANWLLGIVIERRGATSRVALLTALTLNLGLLAAVKYTGFLVGNVNAAFGLNLAIPGIALPLGISFYTFSAVSYIIDVYRGDVPAERSALRFLAYLTMFPKLIMGPVTRYPGLCESFADIRVTLPDFSAGVTRFAMGLGKKVLLADAAGAAAASLLGEGVKLTATGSWLGVIFFAFQIYYDFSGYTDMAIGIGRMTGFKLGENFDYPYTARSITEFWRRWHISLSSFFRDYVYIPLGGNKRRQIRNIAVVWLLTGLWHGASWNFIIWGLYYGALLVIEKKGWLRQLDRMPGFARRIYTLAAVTVGWAIFYFPQGDRLLGFARAAVGIGVAELDIRVLSVLGMNLLLLPVLVVGCTPLPRNVAHRIRAGNAGKLLEPVCNALVMAASFVTVVGQSYKPFLYFQF